MEEKVKESGLFAPKNLPNDYPFGDRLSESLADYAKRINRSLGTIRWQADTGRLPVIQHKKGCKREVNLLAIYMNAKHKADQYVASMNEGGEQCQTSL